MPRADHFGALAAISTPAGSVSVYRLDILAKSLGITIDRLPFSIRILLGRTARM
jgi:hypothetical protein